MSRLDGPLSTHQPSTSLMSALIILVVMIYKQGTFVIRHEKKIVEQKMKILLFLCRVAFSSPYARLESKLQKANAGLLDEMLNAMDKVYSWKIVNYDGEYQNGMRQVDDDAVQIAFEHYDSNNDMKVSKEEMLRSVFKFFGQCRVIIGQLMAISR